jgi:hypothetical protein
MVIAIQGRNQAMPILEAENRSMPRSALRYRPISADEVGPAPVMARRSRPDALATAAKVAPDVWDDEEEQRLLYPRRQRRVPAPRQSATPAAHARRRLPPLFWLGMGALLLLLLWWTISQVLVWSTNQLNTLHYGYPRTFQMDAVVGHNDNAQHPSHFVALNFHGTITIIEFPGGDPAKARTFVLSGVLGPESDLDPVTLKFVDIGHTGFPDMLIDVGNVESVLVNDQGTFRSPSPAEQQQILQQLRQMGQ